MIKHPHQGRRAVLLGGAATLLMPRFAFGQAKPLVRYSAGRRRQNLELRKFLYQNLYFNPVVHEPNLRAIRMLEELFNYYLQHPDAIGQQSRKRMRREGLHRAVCDYLAGMTDRYALQEHHRLFGVGF